MTMFYELQPYPTNLSEYILGKQKKAHFPRSSDHKRYQANHIESIELTAIGTATVTEIRPSREDEFSQIRLNPSVRASIDELEKGGGYRFDTISDMFDFLESD